MSTEFLPGQNARAIRTVTSKHGVGVAKVAKHAEVTVEAYFGGREFTARLEGETGLIFSVEDFEPVAPPDPTAPAPLDPSKVKAGDTVTLERVGGGLRLEAEVGSQIDITVAGKRIFLNDFYRDGWTLTAHTPAPEPEPEWLFEFKGEEGPEGDEHWVRRFPSRTDALRSMIESANLDELNDFEGPVSFSVYTEETGPAESRLVVIDPAAVDVEALAQHNGLRTEPLRGVLRDLGIEVPR